VNANIPSKSQITEKIEQPSTYMKAVITL